MARKAAQGKNSKAEPLPAEGEPGYEARDLYKARLTRGLLGVGLGEGPIVEILNYRTKRVLRRELIEDPDHAREELDLIREDIKRMTTEEFRSRYLKPPPE